LQAMPASGDTVVFARSLKPQEGKRQRSFGGLTQPAGGHPSRWLRRREFMRLKKRLLALSAAAAVASARAALGATATWVPLGGSSSWNNSAKWDTNIVPNGPADGAFFNEQSGGPIVLLGGTTITLSTLDLSDPLFTGLTGGTINLTGAAVINASGANFDLPD